MRSRQPLVYRKLILLRRAHSVLVAGKTSSIAAEKNLLRFERAGSAERFLILLNMGHNPVQAVTKTGAICMSTCLDREGDTVSGFVRLRASEGIIIRLAALF